jgi:hypothetical protein
VVDSTEKELQRDATLEEDDYDLLEPLEKIPK